MGIGTQGLADVFALLRVPFESEKAKEINKNIYETIYHAAIETSMEISKKRHNMIHNEVRDMKDDGLSEHEITLSVLKSENNHAYLKLNEYEQPGIFGKYPGAYTTFDGSPASRGELQFDMWGVDPGDRYDWTQLKQDIKTYGLRNSLLVAPMPTASTSQIMGFNESFEPITNNLFKRKTLSGEFVVMNKYLIRDLIDLGLWDKAMKNKIMANEGSVQNIDEIPDDMKSIYRTVWEIKQKALIDLSIGRGPYICQSQSLNIFMEDPDFKKLSSMHFYGWSKGLKTGSYYLRTRPRVKMQQFTLDPLATKVPGPVDETENEDNNEPCLTCSA